MAVKLKIVVPFVAMILIVVISGCATQKPVKDLTPEEVVTQFWNDIGEGNYDHAYDLAYHANQNQSKQMWVDEHLARWGENGSYIKIYKFSVTENYAINASEFEGGFNEARVVNTNATIAYFGKNTTGQLRMVLVNTTDGWKVFGNY